MSSPKISRKPVSRAPRHPQVPTSWAARPRPKRRSRWRLPRLLGLVIILTGVASLSATAGALLAVSLSATPLQQHPLAHGNKAVFRQDEPISSGGTLRLPHLTRPVNILVMGIKVITADLKEVPPELRHLPYQALVNSFDGLADSMLLIRFDPQTQQVAVLSLPRDTRTYVQGRLTKLNEANPLGGPALTAESVSDLLGG
ncbi:MAG: LCP family protein [Nodosilinea sp. LVE1205-7]